MHEGKTLRLVKIKQINLKTILNRKKGPNSAFLSPHEPEDLGAWERDILCHDLGYRVLGGVRPQPPSFRVCIFDDPDPSLPSETAAP